MIGLQTAMGAAPKLPMPTKSSSTDDIEKYNEEARAIYTASMAQCVNCGRRFEAERLEVHLRSCKPKEEKGGRQLPPGMGGEGGAGEPAEGAAKESRKPKMLVCYICGQVWVGMSRGCGKEWLRGGARGGWQGRGRVGRSVG